MAKVTLLSIAVGHSLEFDETEWVILQHWYDSGNVFMLMCEPVNEENKAEEEDEKKTIKKRIKNK